ncbi:sigma-70 family RNA polymerase sigma factor [Microbacterium luteolum]|uniref:Sigma-70 family RNA polymerase sigma factor n=1 Tax=Microbacterium luteolum TaxID=69367 RepID=A0ABY7XQ88_MICLT|nr:sigma-70 family RNA polymerase sigma factor [Microbacterium luteolum]WDM44291.1 sigma-70 family RNA polymerase sigma factor [Microbacterium luteolum]
MYATEADGELIRLARRGDRGAFSALYARHSKAVYLYAWSMMRADSDAEDIVQEAFLIAWRRLRDIRIHESSALPWLLVTCRNLCRNATRARRSALPLVEELLPGDRVRQERMEELSWVRQAVDRLGGIDRRIIHLCLVEGYSYDEAAAHLGLSSAALAKRLQRARASIRVALRGET